MINNKIYKPNLRDSLLISKNCLEAYYNYGNPRYQIPRLDDGTPLTEAFSKDELKIIGENARKMLEEEWGIRMTFTIK